MTETLPVPHTPEAGEASLSLDEAYGRLGQIMTQYTEAEELGVKILLLEKAVEGVNIASAGDVEAGKSSFRDVSGNLLTSCKRGYECLEDFDTSDKDPDDIEDMQFFQRETPVTTGLLGEYLKLLSEDPKVFSEELWQHDGAYPDLRRLADAEVAEGHTPAAIPFYVRAMIKVHEAEKLVDGVALDTVPDYEKEQGN